MSLGAPIFIGSALVPGLLIPQEGAGMRTTEWGYDEGERRWLTSPSTSPNSYPQRDQPDATYGNMYVREVVPRQDPSGLIEIRATYRGIISSGAGQNKPRVLPGVDTQLMSIGVLSSGTSMTLLAPIPQDTCTYEYVTTTQPTKAGVAQNTNASFLGSPAPFSITFVADPSAAAPPLNYFINTWVLEDRTWEDVASKVFLVRERYRYYNRIGS
jgi:hypothetical protein